MRLSNECNPYIIVRQEKSTSSLIMSRVIDQNRVFDKSKGVHSKIALYCELLRR